MQRSITVLDLGSSKIAALTANIGKRGELSLSSRESLYSRGINEGEIIDIHKAIEDISLIMNKLEQKEQKKLKHIFVTMRNSDIEMALSRGMIPLSKTPREITKRDLMRCLELAAMVRLPLDRQVVQKVVKAFHIDGRDSAVQNPVGLYGIKLEVESFIATASRSRVQSITKCVDHAGFLLEGIYLSSIAASGSVLDREEKEKGVLLLDIGDTLTELLIFKNGLLRDSYIIKKGAKNCAGLLEEMRAILPSGKPDFSSLVLTGGGALIDGIIESAEKVFGIPARMGIVKNAGGSKLNSQDALIHTSTAGLINELADEYKTSHVYHPNPFHRIFHKFHTIYDSYF